MALPLEVDQRLNVLRDSKGANDLVIANLSSQRGAQLIEVFWVGEDSALALCIEQRHCRICRDLAGLFEFLNRPFPDFRKRHCGPEHCGELSSCLAHAILRSIRRIISRKPETRGHKARGYVPTLT